jgi:hypothetical protein
MSFALFPLIDVNYSSLVSLDNLRTIFIEFIADHVLVQLYESRVALYPPDSDCSS